MNIKPDWHDVIVTSWIQIPTFGILLTILVILIVRKRHSITETQAYTKLEIIKQAIYNSPEAFIIINAAGKITNWNKGAVAVLGIEKTKALGETLNIIIPERFREAHAKGLARMGDGRDGRIIGHGSVEMMALHGLGVEIPVELTLWRIDVEGDMYFVGMIRNISARKERDEKNQQIIELYRKMELIDHCGVWEWDTEKDELYVSPGFKTVYEVEVDTAPSSFFRKKVFHEDEGIVDAAIAQMRETKEGYDIQYRIVCNNGKLKWIRSTTCTEIDDQGNIIRIYGVAKTINK